MDVIIVATFGTQEVTIDPKSCVISAAACNESLQHQESTVSAELVYDPDLFSLLVAHDEFAAVLRTREGETLFTGVVTADTSWKDMGEPYPIDVIPITIRDRTGSLDRNIDSAIVMMDTTLALVLDRLASDCGLSVDGPVPAVDIPIFTAAAGRKYLSVLDTLCYNHKTVFRFDELGRIVLLDFSAIPGSIPLLDDGDLMAGVTVRKAKRKCDSVRIGYNTLAYRTNELIYRESPDYDSAGIPVPVIIQPGVYYPFESTPSVEATEGQVYQSFEAGYAESTRKANGEIAFRRSKNSTLLHSYNHQVVQDWIGSLTIDRTAFESLRSAVRLLNTGATDAELYQFAIRADAIYRDADASILVGPDSGTPYEMDAEFLFTAAAVESLAVALYRYFARRNHTIEFQLDQTLLPAAAYRRLDTGLSGYAVDTLLISYTYDCETRIATYRAIPIGDATVDVTRYKNRLADDRPRDGEPGTAAPNLQTQYSVDGSTGWTATYNASHIYMRTSADGGTTWGAAVRIKGETGTPGTDGLFTDYRFAKNTSATTAPEYTAAADNPGAAWTDTPPTLAANEYLWMLNADWRGATRLTNWTAPVRLSGPQGTAAPNLQTQYSVDGSTGWTATYNSSHIYMRTSADGGTTWGAAARIKGETGAAGADGPTPFTWNKRGSTTMLAGGSYRSDSNSDWVSNMIWTKDGYKAACVSGTIKSGLVGMVYLDSSPTARTEWAQMDAVWHFSRANCYIACQGEYWIGIFEYVEGDVLSITYDGQAFRWYKNGELVQTRVKALTKLYGAWVSPYAGHIIESIKFGPMGETGTPGTDGQFTDYRFAKNTSATVAPTYTAAADNPGAAWTDTPPTLAANEYLWMINADWRGATRLTDWAAPVRLSGPQGSAAPNLQTQYSVDGSTGWTATYNASHIYMRTSADGGTTWGSAVRIKGETGLQGVRAWQYLGPATSDPTSGMVSGDIYLYTTSLTVGAGDSKLRKYTTAWADVTTPTSDQISAAMGDILNRATFLAGIQQAVGLVAFFARIFALDIVATGSITGAIFKSLDGKIKISRNVSGAFDGIIISTGLVDSPVNGDFQVLLTTGSGGVPGIHFYKRVSGAWQDQGKIISNFLGLADSLSNHYGDSYTQLDSSGFLVSKVFRAKKGIAPTLLNVTSPVTDAVLFDKLADYTVMDDGIYTLHGIAYTPTSAMYGINIRKFNSTTYYIKFDVDGSLEAIVQGGATQRGRFYAVY